MHLLFYLAIIVIFKQIINNIFKNTVNKHSLFRTFFCFFISSLSLCFSIYHWQHLLSNSLEPTYLSFIINKLMLSYMLVDTFFITTTDVKELRIELIFHHAICIGLYGLFYDKAILSFCALGEILSSFNWIGIIYPQYEWSVKLFRLYSIIFIRFFVWVFTLVFLRQYLVLFWFGLLGVIIFFALDCYWAWIILSNCFKYKKYIQGKIISKTKKIISKTGKNKNYKKMSKYFKKIH